MEPLKMERRPKNTGKKSLAGFEQHRRSASATNRRFYAAGAVILVAAVVIIVVAMQGSSVYYISIAEFNTKQTNLAAGGKEVRVAGKVIPGTIARDEASRSLTFMAMDKADPTQTMKVVYNKIVPDTFKDEADVVVTGTYQNGVFTANEMLAKCPSKYSSSEGAN